MPVIAMVGPFKESEPGEESLRMWERDHAVSCSGRVGILVVFEFSFDRALLKEKLKKVL